MKRNQQLFCCLFGVSLVFWMASAQWSVAAANPYQEIIDRNVFALRIIEPQHIVTPAIATPKFSLVGITTVLTSKRAILRVLFPASQASPAVELCFMLAEGQGEGEIEISKIDEAAGSISLTYMGEFRTLVFEPQTCPGGR